MSKPEKGKRVRSRGPAKPEWMNRAEHLANEASHPVNGRGERIYPIELPAEERAKLTLDTSIRETMMDELERKGGRGLRSFGTLPRQITERLTRACSADIGRDVSAETIIDYLRHGDFKPLHHGGDHVWDGYGEAEIQEVKATLMKEILGPSPPLPDRRT